MLHLVAGGVKVNLLITVDPVGWSRPWDLSDVASNSKFWVNINATGSFGHSGNDGARFFGRAYRNSPSGFADLHTEIRGHDHVSILDTIKF